MTFERYVYPPTRDPLLEAYEKNFESAFVVLHPFLRVPEELSWRLRRQYPSDGEILAQASKCRWSEVAQLAGIRNCATMSQALLTSIGSIEDYLADYPSRDALKKTLETEAIWMPTEGRFEPLLQADLLTAFAMAGCKELVYVPEFPQIEPIEVLSVTALKEQEKTFPERGSLVAPDESFLVTVDWDSFFCLFYGPRSFIRNVVDERKLEGFFAEPETEHFWFNWKMGCATCTVSPEGWPAPAVRPPASGLTTTQLSAR